MGRITSSVGLATGLPIQETVDQLIALQARRRDLLVNQNKKIDAQRTAVTALTAQLVAIQIQIRRLSSDTVFTQRTVSTSDTDILEAVSTGTPDIGHYQFTPLRLAQAQQLQSSRFASKTDAIGAGTFSFRFGGQVDKGVDLDMLNGGAGFVPGSIRITDRGGVSANIDLSLARDIDDVLDAINGNGQARVRATVYNDRIRLVDQSGAAISNLRVEELGGTTAASLGLAGIDVADTQADALDILTLFDDLPISSLNDGNGVRFDGFLGDLRITLRDGSRLNLDFNKLADTGTFAAATTTAANGIDSAIVFTAKESGPDLGGVNISFVNDASVIAGREIVEYDAEAKTLVFRIEAGATTANQIIAALANHDEAAAAFAAAPQIGGNGSGVVAVTDTAVTVGPTASATTPGGENAKLLFKAKNPGEAYDNVAIRFVDDPAVTQGSETVAYDESNPLNKQLVFRIDAGNTTANNIIAALAADPVAGELFSAENSPANNGSGVVSLNDTAFTTGGTLRPASEKTSEIMLKQVLDVINAAAADKLQASIGANNNLVLTDLTTDAGYEFKVEQLNGSHAADDLGLEGEATGGVITGRRLLAGLKTSLVESFNGGKGLGPLGLINITDRSGAAAQIDLAAVETLDDILEAINTAGIGVAARVNDARNGILIADTSGGTGNLIVADADETNTAEKLGLIVDAAQAAISSGSLRLQVISEATLLSSLNGGAGVSTGTVRITDNDGVTGTLTIDQGTKTIGDVLTAIERLNLKIDARINDDGDGILLVDTKGSGTTFDVNEGNGKTAADLHLLGEKKTVTIDNVETQVIDGSTTIRIELTATDTLEDLVRRINDASSHVRASIFSDGSTVKPFRFTLFNKNVGEGSELLWDTSGVNFTLHETVQAQDALVQFGPAGEGGVLAASRSNTFQGLVPDISLTLKGTSTTPVSVTVAPTDEGLVKAVSDFVEAYNKVRDKIKELTRFDEATQTAAVLQGDGRLLRVENDLANLVSGRILGAGAFQSLEAVGIKLKEDGKLELDEAKLKERFAESPADVTEFFSAKDTGLSARFDKLVEQLAGVGDTVLVGRVGVLTRKIEQNQGRIDLWNVRLEKQRERLLKSFQQSETIIAKLQSSLASLNAIAPLPIIVPQ
jgi:flagellar hook-associated protein 2